MMKNIAFSEVLTLKDQIQYQQGQVVSRTLVQNNAVSVTLFSFDKDEKISTHESDGDAFIICIVGVCRITIEAVEYERPPGESIAMYARHPHAVCGREQIKMMRVVIF